MKILKQFGVIFGVCWISLVIEHYLPFSVPPVSTYFMFLFFVRHKSSLSYLAFFTVKYA